MSKYLWIHSDLKDDLTDAFGEALNKFIDDANGMFGYVLGDPTKLEMHTEGLVRDYLALGRVLAEVTDRYRGYYDPSPEDLTAMDADL